MCGNPFKKPKPQLPKPEPVDTTPKETPRFGVSNKTLNNRKGTIAKRKGTNSFQIALQTGGNSGSGLNVPVN